MYPNVSTRKVVPESPATDLLLRIVRIWGSLMTPAKITIPNPRASDNEALKHEELDKISVGKPRRVAGR